MFFVGASNVKGRIERKLSSKKFTMLICQWACRSGSMKSSDFVLQKAHPCMNLRRFSHFA